MVNSEKGPSREPLREELPKKLSFEQRCQAVGLDPKTTTTQKLLEAEQLGRVYTKGPERKERAGEPPKKEPEEEPAEVREESPATKHLREYEAQLKKNYYEREALKLQLEARKLGLPPTAGRIEINKFIRVKRDMDYIKEAREKLRKKISRKEIKELETEIEQVRGWLIAQLNLPETATLKEIKKATRALQDPQLRNPLDEVNELVTEDDRRYLVGEFGLDEELSDWEDIKEAADIDRPGEYGLIERYDLQKNAKWEKVKKAVLKKMTKEYGLDEEASLEKIEEAARQKFVKELKLEETAPWGKIEEARQEWLKRRATEEAKKEEGPRGLKEGFREFVDKNPRTAITVGGAGLAASLVLGIIGLWPVALLGLVASGYTIYRGVKRSFSLEHEPEQERIRGELAKKYKPPETATWEEIKKAKKEKEKQYLTIDEKRREKAKSLGLPETAGWEEIGAKGIEIEEAAMKKLARKRGLKEDASLWQVEAERKRRAKELGLKETASWEEIGREEEKLPQILYEQFEEIKKNIPPLGGVFDIKKEMAELKKIKPHQSIIIGKKEKSRKEVREIYKEHHERQKEALALCHSFIEREIENNPDVEKDKLIEWVKKFAQNWGFTGEHKKNAEQIIDEYYKKRTKSRSFLANYRMNKTGLIKELTGVELSNEEIEEVPKISLEQMAVVIEANGSIVDKLFEQTKGSVPNMPIHGFANIGGKGIYYIVINRESDRKKIKEHEFQHLENRLLRGVFGELSVRREKSDYELQPNNLERLEKYLRAEQKYNLNRVKDELLAMLQNQEIKEIEQNWKNVFLNTAKGNPYDYLAELRNSDAYKKNPKLTEDILQTGYEKIIANAVNSLSDLIEKGRYSVDEAVDFLSYVDLEFWPANVRRKLKYKENKSTP